MTCNNKSSVVFGAALALFISANYKYPYALTQFLNHQSILRDLGWERDPARFERARQLVALVACQERAAARTAITHKVIRGESTLLEAAESFRQVAKRTILTRDCLEDPDDPVAMCRSVIRWVTAQSDVASAAEVQEVLFRLEGELRRAQSQPGPIEFPAPPRAVATTTPRH
jgi:hypothetical protein